MWWMTARMHVQVLIDGINIKELNLRWLRQQIALVSQEPALFTVRSTCPAYRLFIHTFYWAAAAH